MKIRFRRFSVFAFVLGFIFTAPSFAAGEQLLGPASQVRGFVHVPGMKRVSDARREHAKLRALGFDLPGVNTARQEIEIIGSRAAFDKLVASGAPVREEPWPTKQGRLVGPDPRFLNPDRLEQNIKALAAKFPNVSRLEVIGKTLQGRGIFALVVGENPDVADPRFHLKPTLYMDGLHHAREVMTPEIVMDAASTVLTGVQQRVPAAVRALTHWNFVFIPMVNPDGSNLAFTADPMWRKNAHASSQGRVHGVDINRNYSFNWNACNGSSGSTGAQDYRGASAASEPETQAIMAFAAKVRPAVALSYHSYSELILYPYGCKGAYTGDKELHVGLAKELSKLLPSDSKRGFYQPGTPWEILYSVDGDSMGFLHAAFGSLGFTFEVNQEFQPKYELRGPTVEKQRKAWQGLLAMADARMLALQVVDRRKGQPVAGAKIELAQVPHRYNEAPFLSNLGGNFFKVLLPGTHEIRVTLPDGRSKTEKFELGAGKPVVMKVTID